MREHRLSRHCSCSLTVVLESQYRRTQVLRVTSCALCRVLAQRGGGGGADADGDAARGGEALGCGGVRAWQRSALSALKAHLRSSRSIFRPFSRSPTVPRHSAQGLPRVCRASAQAAASALPPPARGARVAAAAQGAREAARQPARGATRQQARMIQIRGGQY